MPLDPAAIINRRRLKRRLNFWRIFGTVAALVAIMAVVGRFSGPGFGEHVARLDVSGIILSDPFRDQALRELADNDQVRALIVQLDSPGGTFIGGESLYKTLRIVADKKPVVAVMGGTATSAAYMAAVAADHIVASGGTVTGSIGVIMQTADVTGLLEKLGIKPEMIKSGPLKAQPNPFEPFSPAARDAMALVIKDLFSMFVDMVTERRGMSREDVLAVADGRIFTGRQAKDGGLIDGLGGEPEARLWLVEKHGIAKDLPIENVKISHDDQPWRDVFGSLIGKALFSERLRLDGAISLWHPELR
ncbi:MAG: signal peptide peptidase SppA [Rhodospirillaceae bacterium]|nr:signal peptide peptidase SppA [Rhodospirillaceae bacterium]MBT3911090.1 signal peptide peptidase SppA [Rhodospirillaceae bacterium]MBT5514784.1 signal peptide peptidase SppA [Rhodospirillaceae bacterium]MBT6085000.1 signal peptide peptidase SppA [Rhodospirillaceae bacterium]MBT6883307.1 signal peptide peptidase SppA [Rhodospirillaceae bacterium]